MIVVGKHDPAPGANRGDHCTNHGQGVGNMLEQEPRVREVERAPLVAAEWKSQSVPWPQLDKIRLSCRECLSRSLGTLFGVALDPDDPRRKPDGPCHGASELPDPAADVQDRFTALEIQFAQRSLVQEIVQPGQAALFGRRRPVDVAIWCRLARGLHGRYFPSRSFLRTDSATVTCLAG